MEFSKISNQNPWWKFGSNFEPFDPDLAKLRDEWTAFERRTIPLRPNEVTTLLGPRQVGKTALIKHTIRELIRGGHDPRSILYLSCDVLISGSRRELNGVLNNFFTMTRNVDRRSIFLDEIGRVKDWDVELKEMMDAGSLRNTSLVVTGSFVRGLDRFSELFPGRPIHQLWVPPLSFRSFTLGVLDRIRRDHRLQGKYPAALQAGETLKNNFAELDDLPRFREALHALIPHETELQEFWEIYLRTGGFPHAANAYCSWHFAASPSQPTGLTNAYETYAKVGVDDIVRLDRSESILRQILAAVVRSTGSRISLNSLSKASEEGLTHVTIGDYIELLRQSLVLRTCYAYDPDSKSVRPKANRKIYLIDPFIHYSVLAWLEGIPGAEITDRILQDEMQASRIVELIVAQHLALTGIKPFMREPEAFLWFYYDNRREMDFLYRTPHDHLLGIEVKYQEKTSPSEITTITGLDGIFLVSKRSTELADPRVLMVPASIFTAALDPSPSCL